MQIELGDMIHWDNENGDTDLGWVVRIENRAGEEVDEELTILIFIQWLLEECTDHLWENRLLEHPYMTITKGGQYD